jgi:hypothetical protein
MQYRYASIYAEESAAQIIYKVDHQNSTGHMYFLMLDKLMSILG